MLKNALDWISRPHLKNETSLSAYSNKVITISSASPGGLGGLRGLVPLRMMLSNIGVIVTPSQVAISSAMKAFDDNGNLKDENQKKRLSSVVEELVSTARKISSD